MYFGLSRTAPIFPPPWKAVEPGGGCGTPNRPRIGAYPGQGQLGPGRSPQQAALPSVVLSGFPSSNVTTTSVFPLLYAGEPRISGIQCLSQRSAPTSPPTWPPSVFVPAQVASCPSLQRFGVMNENAGVVTSFAKSCAR